MLLSFLSLKKKSLHRPRGRAGAGGARTGLAALGAALGAPVERRAAPLVLAAAAVNVAHLLVVLALELQVRLDGLDLPTKKYRLISEPKI